MVSRDLEQRAYELGALLIVDSWLKHKKFAVFYRDKWIHFGDNRYDDFTVHRDEDRRSNYIARASGIVDKYGRKTYKLKTSPNFWAYHLLW